MTQGRLFEPEGLTGDPRVVKPMVARAANADPITSFEAAERVERGGRAASHRAIVLAYVRANPGHTSAEIGAATGIGRHEAARRLPELREGGLVQSGAPRRCAINATAAMTWRAIP
jgi:hypothetical protein